MSVVRVGRFFVLFAGLISIPVRAACTSLFVRHCSRWTDRQTDDQPKDRVMGMGKLHHSEAGRQAGRGGDSSSNGLSVVAG